MICGRIGCEMVMLHQLFKGKQRDSTSLNLVWLDIEAQKSNFQEHMDTIHLAHVWSLTFRLR